MPILEQASAELYFLYEYLDIYCGLAVVFNYLCPIIVVISSNANGILVVYHMLLWHRICGITQWREKQVEGKWEVQNHAVIVRSG